MPVAELVRPIAPGTAALEALRAQVARIQGSTLHRSERPAVPFGITPIDAAIPGGGILQGALHEAAGTGADTHLAACPAMFIGSILARLPGPVLWIVDRQEPFAAGFTSIGFDPDRLLIAEASKDVLSIMEEGLHHAGLVAVVGEVSGRLDLTASRRLQLAAEASGVTAFALRRSRKHDDPVLSEPNASLTRWRISPTPSPPVRSDMPGLAGVGRWRWRLDLARARGGEARSWLVEAPDDHGRMRLATDPEVHVRPAARDRWAA